MKVFFCIDAEVFSVFMGFRRPIYPEKVERWGGWVTI
jgi:hypothetical protein